MAEALRELVVALSLDSSNFSRNMRTINQQIKEAESTFRLAGAGVENYEKTIAGTEAKLSMLGQKLTQQQRAVEQYSRALVAANDKLKENYDRHQDYSQRLEQAKAKQEDLRFEVETATVAYDSGGAGSGADSGGGGESGSDDPAGIGFPRHPGTGNKARVPKKRSMMTAAAWSRIDPYR